jgi:hypothetical protein
MSDQRTAASLRRNTGYFTLCQPYKPDRPRNALRILQDEIRKASSTVPMHG